MVYLAWTYNYLSNLLISNQHNMKAVTTFVLLVVVALSGTSAQNAPTVNWAQVVPIYRTPGFFEDYPVLRQIYNRQSPLTSSLEGNSTLRNQFPYQVSHS